MKSYNLLTILTILAFYTVSNAQEVSYSGTSLLTPVWSLEDRTVWAYKASILALTGLENIPIDLMKTSFRTVRDLEKEYDDKRSATAYSATTSAVIGLAVLNVEFTEDKIKDLLIETSTIKKANVFFKYRIDGIESDLLLEQGYIDDIQTDYTWLSAGVVFGGGPGYSYTAFLKILLRTMKIKRNVLDLEKEINNLNTNNLIFVKK